MPQTNPMSSQPPMSMPMQPQPPPQQQRALARGGNGPMQPNAMPGVGPGSPGVAMPGPRPVAPGMPQQPPLQGQMMGARGSGRAQMGRGGYGRGGGPVGLGRGRGGAGGAPMQGGAGGRGAGGGGEGAGVAEGGAGGAGDAGDGEVDLDEYEEMGEEEEEIAPVEISSEPILMGVGAPDPPAGSQR